MESLFILCDPDDEGPVACSKYLAVRLRGTKGLAQDFG